MGSNGGEAFRTMVHVVRGRWFMIFASLLIMIGAGATYLFGIYSKQLKISLGYNQTTLNLLGFYKDIGSNVGILSGLMAEVAPPGLVLLVGATMNFVGYFMIWLAVVGKIPKPQIWQMCLYICIGANSQNFANTSALVCCVKNFPESRGVMLGLLKGFIGLSGALLTQLYLAIYGDDAKSLILLISWLPSAITVIFVYTIRTLKVIRRANEIKTFYRFLYVSIALALYLMAMIIIQKKIVFSHTGHILSATCVCILLFLPLGIAIKEELVEWKLKKQLATEIIVENPQTEAVVESKTPSATTMPTSSTTQSGEKPNVSCFGNICNKPKRGEDYTILQGLLSIDMLILFLSTMCGLGASLTAVDNLGQIGESLGYHATTISSFVSLVSIWNYCGRVFAGFVSEILLEKLKFPRTLMLTLILLTSCIGHLFIAFPFPGSVYIASVIIGFSFGAQVPLLFAIISELFGLKYYSTLFNFGQMASPIGSYILNVMVAGPLYDREATKQLSAKGIDTATTKDFTCIGKQCYRLTFIILAATSLFGGIISLVLVMRTYEFYKGDIYKKFKDEAKVCQVEMASSSNNEARKGRVFTELLNDKI